METAYGIFETKGYAAAVAAADKILQERSIELIKLEKTGNGLISLFFEGKPDLLISAFEDGIKEARLVGEIFAVHVSKKLNDSIRKLLFSRKEGSLNFSQKNETNRVKSKAIIKAEKPSPLLSKKSESSQVKSSSSTIQRLRREALSSEHALQKKSNKSKITENRSMDQINISKINVLNVHDLRKLARSTSGFPIQGREISKANRKELIVYFKDLG